MNLCTKCCKLVPVEESEAHCAAHAAASHTASSIQATPEEATSIQLRATYDLLMERIELLEKKILARFPGAVRALNNAERERLIEQLGDPQTCLDIDDFDDWRKFANPVVAELRRVADLEREWQESIDAYRASNERLQSRLASAEARLEKIRHRAQSSFDAATQIGSPNMVHFIGMKETLSDVAATASNQEPTK